MYDLIIKNGKIIDGTGSPALLADVAVNGGKIVRVARGIKEDAAQVIDASGLAVTPGFIDSHSHADSAVLKYPAQAAKIEQGITTSIAGQCGTSPMPMGDFFEKAKAIPQGANIAVFAGHGALRREAMGAENRPATPEEIEKMKALLRDCMEHGALGISFGLIYAPSCYADTAELTELAKVVAEYDGIAAAHIRNEGDTLVQAVEEFISIIRTAGIRGVISHHKAAGKNNWGKVTHTLRMMEAANAEGVEVYCDVYPYTASSTTIAARFAPSAYHSGGIGALADRLHDPEIRAEIREYMTSTWGNDYKWVLITGCKAYPQYVGKTLEEAALLHGKDCADTVMDMIADSRAAGNACYFTMCEEDVETVMAYPRAMICTDSSTSEVYGFHHPRVCGSFPRVLGRYVRERGVTTLPEMIRKMTSMPAAVYGLTGKGLIREGFDADICIFDPDTIIDRAEYLEPKNRAEGLHYVLVGGEVVVENAAANGKCCGRVLLRNE